MWWLLFRDGGVVVIGASSLVHARLLAAAKGLGRASHFVEGNFVDTERLPPIPTEFIGRMLSPIEARQLEEFLRRGPPARDADRGRGSTWPSPQD
jgi:hypothetical protein